MSAQGVSPGRSTVSIASKRDGSGRPVPLASSDRHRDCHEDAIYSVGTRWSVDPAKTSASVERR